MSREDGRIFVLPHDGDELGIQPFDAPGIVLDAAAIDDRGRAWMATPSVVMVAGLTGQEPTETWTRGAVRNLDGRVSAMAVLRAGLPLPERQAVRHRPVTLSIVDAAPASDDFAEALVAEGDQPAGNADVELCRAEHDNLLATTPCGGSPSRVAGVTAPGGTLTLQIASGLYTAAIQTADGWYRVQVEVPVSASEPMPTIDLTHTGW